MPLAALSPLQREPLIDFLCGAFGLPKTAPFVQPALLRWKYDEPRPDWQGPRSYAWVSTCSPDAAPDGAEIAAHACLCPVTYRLPRLPVGSEISASYLIDWAAARRIPGAGGLLLRKLASFFQVLLAIGGSTDTQRILPKLGFRAAGDLAFFVRVVRPWRQFRTDPFPRGWKAPLRLVRNSIWSHASLPEAPANWTCSPLPSFHSSHNPILEAPAWFPSTRRNAELMNYWLRCPGARISAFLLSDHEGPRGWFLLSRVAGVIRIADLRIHSSDPQHWQAAYALATQAALADPLAYELVATASTPPATEALRRNGFRWHHAEPVFLLDPHGLLRGHTPLEITLIESDAAWLYTPEYPYLS